MKEMTENEARLRLETLCASSEQCSHDMEEKLRKWGITEEARARIMAHLVEERYVDDERFCRAFVKDKIRYNKWGRRKVEQALFLKRIPNEVSRPILNAMDDEEYLRVLRPLLASKRRSLRAADDYEARAKLVRFALGRGFSYDLIRRCMKADDITVDDDGADDEFLA